MEHEVAKDYQANAQSHRPIEDLNKEPEDKTYTEAIKDYIGDKVSGIKEAVFYGGI